MSKPLNAYEQLAKDMADVEYKSAARPVLQHVKLHPFQQEAMMRLDVGGERRYRVINATEHMSPQERQQAAERFVKFLNDNREYLSAKPLGNAVPLWLRDEDDEIPDLAQIRTTPWPKRFQSFVVTTPKPVDPWWPQVTGGKTKIGPTDV